MVLSRINQPVAMVAIVLVAGSALAFAGSKVQAEVPLAAVAASGAVKIISLDAQPKRMALIGTLMCPMQVQLNAAVESDKPFAGKAGFMGPNAFDVSQPLAFDAAGQRVVQATFPVKWEPEPPIGAPAGTKPPARAQKLSFNLKVAGGDARVVNSLSREVAVECRARKTPAA